MRKFLLSLGLASLLISSVNAEVFAKVDGEDITEKDLEFLRQEIPNFDLNTMPQEMKDRAINTAIERKLLTNEAKKNRSKIESTKEYKEALEMLKDTMLLELWMRNQMNDIKVSDSEVKKYYNANKDKLVKPEMAKARHILVGDEKDAKEIIEKLNKAGKKAESVFANLAQEHSNDIESAKKGGELPPFPRDGMMIEEFSKAAFALKPNTYTKTPVKTQFGYHIIYLESIQPKGVAKYDEVKAVLENELKLQKFRDVIAKKAQDLRKKAKIEMK